MRRFAYAQSFQTVAEYEEAIQEAERQAEGLYLASDKLAAEADAWEDRALTLKMELDNLFWNY
jgi:hypothetical protein